MSRILSRGVSASLHAGITPQADTLLWTNPNEMATAADSTNPTGMHSCFRDIFVISLTRFFFKISFVSKSLLNFCHSLSDITGVRDTIKKENHNHPKRLRNGEDEIRFQKVNE